MSSKLERISEATIQLIHEFGLQSVSMAQIAKNANVAVGTIYNYYTSKEELISGIYSHYMESAVEQCLDYYQTKGSIKKRFFSLNRGFMDYLLKHPVIFNFLDDYYTSPYIYPEAKNKISPYMQRLHEIYDELKEQGNIKDISYALFLRIVNGSITSAIRGYHDNEIADDAFDLETEVLSICWDGLQKIEIQPQAKAK